MVDSFSTGMQGILVSTDSNGNYRWVLSTQHSQVTFWNMANDPIGNIYILAAAMHSFSFGGAQYNFTFDGAAHYVCIKVNTGGNVIWIKDLTPGAFSLGGLSINSTGNLYLVGTFYAPVIIGSTTLTPQDSAGATLFYAKYDSSGNAIWAKCVGGKADDDVLYNFSSSIVLSPDSTFYIAGRYGSTQFKKMIIGNDTLTGGDTMANFIARFDINGNPFWAKKVYYTACPYGSVRGLSTDGNGSIYITGSYSRSFIFGPNIMPSVPSDRQSAMFLTKYNSSGNPEWAKALNTEEYGIGYSVAADNCGNLWMTGGKSEFIINDSFFLAEFDTSGHLKDTIWLRAGGDDMSSIAFDGKGNLFVGGDYGDFTVTPALILGNDTLTLKHNMLEALFVLKYSYELPGCVPYSKLQTGEASKLSGQDILLYPNPTSGLLTITSTNLINQVSITNVLGQSVFSHEYNNEQVQIDLVGLPTGIYLIRINNTEIRKFLKE